MSSNRASTESMPIASSIRARSSAACGPYGMGQPSADELLVGGGVEESLDLRRVGEPDAQHPALAVRVAVDELGRAGQGVVGPGHLAGDRREQVAHGLDRLDDAEGRVAVEGLAGRRQLDEHDVAQLVGGELGDAHDGLVAVDADPLVLLGVAQVAGDHSGGTSVVAPGRRLRDGRGSQSDLALCDGRRPDVRRAACRTGVAPPRRRRVHRGSRRRASYRVEHAPVRRTPWRSPSPAWATSSPR